MSLSELTNYIEDDWDDNKLSTRDNPTEGYFLHPSDGLIGGDVEAGDVLKAVYRPEWTVDTGTPIASSGALQLDSSERHRVITPTQLIVGDWKCDITVSDDQTHYFNFLGGISSPSGIVGYHNSTSRANRGLYKNDGSFSWLITAGTTSGTGSFTQEFTRTPYGNFEWFENSSSQGTATDTFVPSKPHYIEYDSNTSDLTIDNLVIH